MNQPKFKLHCNSCKIALEPSIRILRCTACGGVLDIEYIADNSLQPSLPLCDDGSLITLGEGETPTIELRSTAHSLGLRSLWAKMEFMQPTGSFKDRGSSIMISAAKEQGVTGIVEDSSGNAGASIAAYAAVAGIEAHIFAPSSASAGKLDQIKIFGADLHIVEGSRKETEVKAVDFAQSSSHLVRLPHALSPFFIDGVKHTAYEIVKSSPKFMGKLHIVLPIGNGAMALGLWKGFSEMGIAKLGFVPIIHCIQSRAVSPITSKIRGEDLKIPSKFTTVATGIAVGSPARLHQIEKAVKLSGGTADVVGDEVILNWQKRIAKEEGIFCEPTSATAFAGLESLISNGAIPQNANVLIPVTGTGLKEPVAI